MSTYAEQLASVQSAMAAIEARGQQYEVATDGSIRRLWRGDYAALAAREKMLIPLAAQEARGRSGRRTRQIAPG